MTKKSFYTLLCMAAFACTFLISRNTIKPYSNNNALFLANVEALSQGNDDPKPQKCTKALISGACYREKEVQLPDGQIITMQEFAGMYVSAVKEYEVYPGSPIICLHESVHPCPTGSHM